MAAVRFPAESQFWEVRGTLSASTRSNYCTVAVETLTHTHCSVRSNWLRSCYFAIGDLAYSTSEYAEFKNSFFCSTLKIVYWEFKKPTSKSRIWYNQKYTAHRVLIFFIIVFREVYNTPKNISGENCRPDLVLKKYAHEMDFVILE